MLHFTDYVVKKKVYKVNLAQHSSQYVLTFGLNQCATQLG